MTALDRDDGLDGLERKLAELRAEEQLIDQQLGQQEAAEHGGVAARRPAEQRWGSYSSLTPNTGDVRGRKRALFIRQGAMLGSAALATIMVVALGSEAMQGNDVRTHGAGNELLAVVADHGAALKAVPGVLHNEGARLSPEQQKMFENRIKASESLQEEHAKWDKQRAAHIIKLIREESAYQQQRESAKQAEQSKIAEHRAKLAQKKHERAELITFDEGVSPISAENSELSTEGAQQLAEAPMSHAQKLLIRQKAVQLERKSKYAQQLARDQAIAAARKKYFDARVVAVKAKDALRDALAQRDEMTEKVQGEDLLTKKEALSQLAPIHAKVKKLLQEAVVAKAQWKEAHVALENAETANTTPELKLSFTKAESDYRQPDVHSSSLASSSPKTRKDAAKQHLAEKHKMSK